MYNRREHVEPGSAFQQMMEDRVKDAFQFVLCNAEGANRALFDVLVIVKGAMTKHANRIKVAASPHLTPVCCD